MLRLQITENVLSQTTRCRNEFVCLSGSGECLCELKCCYSGKSYFIKANRKKSCNYRVSIGLNYVCSCPTRKEIYKQYSI